LNALEPTRYIDAYESGVRRVSDLLLTLAGVAPLEPLRWLVATAADVARDVGAAQVSAARWLLDG
jgi:hypothetical protein